MESLNHIETDKIEKKGGFFNVARLAIKNLIANNATPIQICAFLIIARYNYRTNTGTFIYTASYSALRKKLGIGKQKAEHVIDDLKTMHYLGSPLIEQSHSNLLECCDIFECYDNYISYFDARFKELNKKKKYKRWILQSDVDDRVLFDNKIIDSISTSGAILKRLVRYNNNDVVKLLLLLHSLNNVSYNTVSIDSLYFNCDIEPLFSEHNVNFYNVKIINRLIVSKSIVGWFDGWPYITNTEYIQPLLDDLEQIGIVSRVVMVFMADSKDAKGLHSHYTIDIKSKQNAEKRELTTLARRMRDIAAIRGHDVGRKDSRFYDEYVVATPIGYKFITVRMVYRLTYGARNIKIKAVSDGIEIRNMALSQLKQSLSLIDGQQWNI